MYEAADNVGSGGSADRESLAGEKKGDRAPGSSSRVMERQLACGRARIHHLSERVHVLEDLVETLQQQLQRATLENHALRRRFRDERRRLEGLVRAAGNEEQTKARVSAGVVSELVTLLHLVAGDLARLKDARFEEFVDEAGAHLAGLEQTVARLIERAADLRDFLKIEARMAPLSCSATDLNAVVEAIAGRVASHLEARGITLVTEYHPDLPVVSIDRDKVETVILHLLFNAARMTRRCGCVRLCTGLQGDHLTISVEDDGPGIAPERLQALSRMFAGVQGGEAVQKSRSGLGLLLVRAIAGSHHGRVEVESAFGKGARFTMVLPVEPRAFEAGEERVCREEGAAKISGTRTSEFKISSFRRILEPHDTARPPSSRATVVVADRESSALYVAVLHLRPHCHVITASTSDEVLRLVSERKSDLVICDMGLESHDAGIAVCRALKAGRNTAHVPVIMTSDVVDADVIRAALEAGAEDFLAKPFVPADLEARVRRWLPETGKASLVSRSGV